MSDHVRELDEKIDAYIEEVWEDVVGDIRTLVRIPSVEDVSAASPGMPWGPRAHEALVAGLGLAERLGMDAHECEGGRIGYADVAGASDRQMFWKVILPYTTPDIFTGVRTAFGHGYTTLVAAEMVAARTARFPRASSPNRGRESTARFRSPAANRRPCRQAPS